MWVCVVHTSLDPLGGGERLCLETIGALRERGYRVVLASIDRTNWSRVEKLWGRVPRPDREVVLSVPLKRFTIYKRLLSSLLIPGLRRICDVIVNTHGDILVSNADITYMHFPTFILWDTSYHKYETGFWRLYFTPYYIVEKRLIKKHVETLLLTNSRYSQSIIHKVFNRKALVVYPPVDIDKYLKLDNYNRRNNIVSIGRFSPEKRYEFIVQVAKHLPEYTFYIIGSVPNTREARNYYEKIRSIIEENNYKK